MKKALIVMLALLAASNAQAQDTSEFRIVRESDLQLEPAQQEELARWVKDVRNYLAWYERYRGRVAKNLLGFPGERKEPPPVLAWMPAKCDVLADFVPKPDGPLREACNLLSYYKSDFTLDPAVLQALYAQKQSEKEPRSSFWKHLHLDGGWTSLDYRMHTYGLVGMHVTLPEIARRIQIYLPPGILLLSMPDGNGGRAFQPAATVGVSIKMFAFEFPKGKEGMAHFNLAKAYVVGRSSPTDTNKSVDLVGLSFTWGQ
jgi:hypothetical protein